MKEEYESPQMLTERADIGALLASNGSPVPIVIAPGEPVCDLD